MNFDVRRSDNTVETARVVDGGDNAGGAVLSCQRGCADLRVLMVLFGGSEIKHVNLGSFFELNPTARIKVDLASEPDISPNLIAVLIKASTDHWQFELVLPHYFIRTETPVELALAFGVGYAAEAAVVFPDNGCIEGVRENVAELGLQVEFSAPAHRDAVAPPADFPTESIAYVRQSACNNPVCTMPWPQKCFRIDDPNMPGYGLSLCRPCFAKHRHAAEYAVYAGGANGRKVNTANVTFFRGPDLVVGGEE